MAVMISVSNRHQQLTADAGNVKTTLIPFAALSSFGWQFLLIGCFRSMMRLARGRRGAGTCAHAPGRVGDAPRAADAAAARRIERENVYK